jgi:hypothetical protein
MSQAGTLLTDLGGNPSPGNDSDLVQQILADMNNAPPSPIVQTHHNVSGNSLGQMPPLGNRGPMINAQQQGQTVYPQSADPAVPTAHMIGRDHPTEADFNRMMMHSHMNNGMNHSNFQPLPQPVMQQQQAPPAKNWIAEAADEFKIPILVAIVCLLVTLPAVNLLVGHYAPKLLRPGGDMNTYGLIARSLSAGLLFWFLQRVVAPLVVY